MCTSQVATGSRGPKGPRDQFHNVHSSSRAYSTREDGIALLLLREKSLDVARDGRCSSPTSQLLVLSVEGLELQAGDLSLIGEHSSINT